MSDGMQNIGAFFRQVRQGMNITLSKASGSGSAAGLSRFERGETDLSLPHAAETMHQLTMDGMDLNHWLARQDAAWPAATTYMLNAGMDDAMVRRLRRYLDAHADNPDTPVQRAARMVFKYALVQPADSVHLSVSEEQFVADFLRYVESWDALQTALLTAIAPYASHDLLALLLRRLVAVIDAGQVQAVLNGRIDAIGWAAIARSDDALVAQALPMVDALLKLQGQGDVDARVLLTAVQRGLHWYVATQER
jgi:hypothetical protein